MKKYLYLVLTILTFGFMLGKVNALTVYSPEKNTYYQRSQHTYAWHDLQGKKYQLFAPAIYIMYKDYEDATNKNDWDFDSKYIRPWTPDNDDYFLALCADLIYDFWPVKTYNVVSLAASTYLKDEIKSNLNAIIKHSYPFVTENEMVAELVSKGVLVETDNKNGEKIYTAPKNVEEHKTELEFTINKDELLSAVQMAVYYFTDHDKVDNVYYSTVGTLSPNFSVLDRSAIYTQNGTYEVVKNNIEAIYNYLINLSDDEYYKPVSISEFAINSKNEVVVKLSQTDSIKNLKLVVKKGETDLKEVDVKDLDKDLSGNYVIPFTNNEDINNVEVALNGTVFKEQEVLVFEAENGPDESQTLIGLSSTDVPIFSQVQKPSLFVKEGDISLEKRASKEVVSSGESFNYTIKVKNNSDNALKDVLVVDEIDSNLDIVKTDGNVNNNKISWTIDLDAQEEKTFVVEIKVKDDVGDVEITNTARVNLYNVGGESSAKVSVIKNPKTDATIVTISSLGIATLALGSALVILRKNKLYKI